MKKIMILVTILMSLVAQANTLGISAGRIVVFADKKEGVFKTDKSIHSGTSEDLKNLKLAGIQKGIHACFIGTADNIKFILNGMIENANRSKEDSFKLKRFESQKDSSINVEVTSDGSKSVYLQMKLGHC